MKMKIKQEKKFISFSLMAILLSSSIILGIASSGGSQNAEAAIPNFNIAAAGDWGCNSATSATVSKIASTSTTNKLGAPELVLGLGDYSYQPTATCWFQKITSIDDNMEIAIGNHENNDDEGFEAYQNKFGFPDSAVYSFNYQNVHILVMNTEISTSQSSSQYAFVQNDLAQASNNPNINWIIVILHKPIYSSPNDCGASSCQGSSSLRDNYHPLFDQFGVDLVLEGHTHDYQRSFPIKYNPASKSNPIKTSSSTSSYNDPEGQVHVIVGTGGVNIHDLEGQKSFIARQTDDFFGHLNMDFTNNGQTMTAKFLKNGATSGEVFDTFTITKAPQAPKYHFEPFLDLNGNEKFDVAHSSTLQLSTFSVASWFKTTSNFAGDAFIMNKGGQGSSLPGQNQNYGIWMNSQEKIRVGFETTSNVAQFLISPNTYNDGNWHLAVGTFDNAGNSLKLYIDGVQVASKTTTDNPDNTGTQPLRVGANSRDLSAFFTGQVDEVRVWNKALSATEISNLYNNGVVPSGALVYLPFNNNLALSSPSTIPLS